MKARTNINAESLQSVRIVVGTGWGDEGKGKIASKESKDADLVIRATGGANAGHTVAFDDKKIALHLVPGGIVYPQTTCLIGQGVVLDIPILLKEIEELEELGVPNVKERLKISGRTHLVFHHHKDLDALYETFKKNPIGTTRRGIGPAYKDQADRTGIRVFELLLPEKKLADLIEEQVKPHNQLFMANNMAENVVDPVALAREYKEFAKILEPMIERNPEILVNETYYSGKKIVVEGAQAARLDLFSGDYPDVTSSNCVTAGAIVGGHLSPQFKYEVIGVAKAISSRVGNGVFPTEASAHIKNDKVLPYSEEEAWLGDIIREKAHEYGASTGRPRRVGWLDLVVLRTSALTMGLDYICLNHLDTVGEIGEIYGQIGLCKEYIYQEKHVLYYPDDMNITGEVPEPVYDMFDGGWKISPDTKSYDDLPDKAKQFVGHIEEMTGVPVKFIGIGPKNDDLLVREDV